MLRHENWIDTGSDFGASRFRIGCNEDEMLLFFEILISINEPGLNTTIISPDSLIMAGERDYYYNLTLGKHTLVMSKRLDNSTTAIG